jgi:hypothetical protein
VRIFFFKLKGIMTRKDLHFGEPWQDDAARWDDALRQSGFMGFWQRFLFWPQLPYTTLHALAYCSCAVVTTMRRKAINLRRYQTMVRVSKG